LAFLIDTNILLRTMQPHHPHCAPAERAVEILRGRHEVLHVAAQNLIEFWAAATRPEGENGLGMSIETVARELSAIQHLFSVLPEIPIFTEWEQVVRKYAVLGRRTHDARLVATMRRQEISHILTFNVDDFARFHGIVVVDPMKMS
jgi:predicted nucleic acid-binding protein